MADDEIYTKQQLLKQWRPFLATLSKDDNIKTAEDVLFQVLTNATEGIGPSSMVNILGRGLMAIAEMWREEDPSWASLLAAYASALYVVASGIGSLEDTFVEMRIMGKLPDLPIPETDSDEEPETPPKKPTRKPTSPKKKGYMK